jgi:3-oxoacyl-[acyl-carrier protein] reductase
MEANSRFAAVVSPGASGILEGKVAVVTGAERALAAGLAAALRTAGASVGEIPSDDLHARDLAQAAFAHAVEELGGPIDIVVHAAIPEVAFEAIDFDRVDDARWEAVWEATMGAAIHALQLGFEQMRGRSGRFVFVTPTVSMSGAARLVPYTTAIEGVRLLAKSAARQWGPDGITVNCLAPAPEHVPIGVVSTDVSLAPAALGGPGDAELDLGPVAVFLASDASHALTGATLCADGGVWMAP